jgi:preprotein translocase subunit SecB
MSKEDSNTPTSGQSSAQLVLQKIYVKDFSFESPNAAELFTQPPTGFNPEINMQLNTETKKLDGDLYEVTLILTITAKLPGSDTTLYLVELKQAGLFTLINFPQKDLAAMANSFCPNILFPYAREAVSSAVERGGFPQLLLAPINFDALYQQHLAKIKTASAEVSSDARH